MNRNVGGNIRALLLSGISNREICLQVGVSSATVSYHAKKIGLAKGHRPTYDWRAVQVDIDDGMSVRDAVVKYGFAKDSYSKAVTSGRLRPRKRIAHMTLSELFASTQNRRTTSHERRCFRSLLIADGTPDACALCGILHWHGKKLCLDLDHIDGNPHHNVRNNLRLLCPNCHSTTDTWRGRNRWRQTNSAHLPFRKNPDIVT